MVVGEGVVGEEGIYGGMSWSWEGGGVTRSG